jgi:predicted small metal-binding protein
VELTESPLSSRLAPHGVREKPTHPTWAHAGTHRRETVAKLVDCGKVNPASGCSHVIRGENEEEVLRLAAEHAKEHGMEASPELLAQVRAHIEDA